MHKSKIIEKSTFQRDVAFNENNLGKLNEIENEAIYAQSFNNSFGVKDDKSQLSQPNNIITDHRDSLQLLNSVGQQHIDPYNDEDYHKQGENTIPKF